MFSGKTTRLIELHKIFTDEGKSVCVINYHGDKRYHESLMSTHDQIMIDCLSVMRLGELQNSSSIQEADIILINEGQFFEDVVSVVTTMVEELGKTVYVAGLDGDYKRDKFGTLLNLIPLCDSIEKLAATCNLCRRAALFSHRLTAEQQQVVIGSSNYISLCRKCYRQMNL